MNTVHTTIFEDTVGVSIPLTGRPISTVITDKKLGAALVEVLGRDINLTPPQSWALEHGFLSGRDDFLLAAPTNSGKSFLATLRALERAVGAHERTVLVVPLKALAEEKADEMKRVTETLIAKGGSEVSIRVSTGDYLLTNDFMYDPPPDSGDIVICTPERLEIMLRNPDAAFWVSTLGCVIIDEVHLLGDRTRGIGMEILLTRLLSQPKGPPIVGLSATFGGVKRIAEWMKTFGRTVHLLESDYRYPPLKRRVIQTDDKASFTKELAAEWIAESGKCGLIFVYTKADADRLAYELNAGLSTNAIASFHAGLPLHERRNRIRRFMQGELRILICTTSLKMGINTPADEVLVRDTVFYGVGRLDATDLVQMIGRAGRQSRLGVGTILMDQSEEAGVLSASLKSGTFRQIEPQLLPRYASRDQRKDRKDDLSICDLTATAVLSLIVFTGRMGSADIVSFLAKSFSGFIKGGEYDVNPCLLELERAKLIYQIENSDALFAATKLGKTICLTGLAPESGAIIGGFLRALIHMSEKTREINEGASSVNYMHRLTDLDLLFLSVVSYEVRDNIPGRLSKNDRGRIIEYIEQLPQEDKPLVNVWRSGTSNEYPTRRLLASLRYMKRDWDAENCEDAFYRTLHLVVMLHRHALGTKAESLSAEYGWHEGEFETGLKATTIWVLSAIAQICNGDRCYKLDFLKLKCFALVEQVKYGSTLGKLMSVDGVGRRTIEKLLLAGIDDLSQLSAIASQKLLDLELTKKQVDSIRSFVGRRGR